MLLFYYFVVNLMMVMLFKRLQVSESIHYKCFKERPRFETPGTGDHHDSCDKRHIYIYVFVFIILDILIIIVLLVLSN